MALENFSASRLSQRNQLLLLTLMMAALCYVFYSFYIQPLGNEVSQLEASAQTMKDEIQKGQIVYSRLPQFKQQVREQEARLANLRGILPEEKETAEMVRGIERLARESRLDVKSFQPQTSIKKEFYEDWPILLSIEGSYNNLGLFFEKVSQFTRIINVDNITINKLEKGSRSRTISATCTATTFVFNENEPPAARPAERPTAEVAGKEAKPRLPI